MRVGRLDQGLPEVLQCVLGNAESMAALRLIAHVAFMQNEQPHAALRRRLNFVAPTHVPSSSDVASHIAFRSCRYRKLKRFKVHEKKALAEKPKAKAVPVKDKKRGLAAHGGRS